MLAIWWDTSEQQNRTANATRTVPLSYMIHPAFASSPPSWYKNHWKWKTKEHAVKCQHLRGEFFNQLRLEAHDDIDCCVRIETSRINNSCWQWIAELSGRRRNQVGPKRLILFHLSCMPPNPIKLENRKSLLVFSCLLIQSTQRNIEPFTFASSPCLFLVQ